MKIIKSILVLPASNAISKRSFSPLKIVQTCLRTTTGDKRLNHLMILCVHKQGTDSLALTNVGFLTLNGLRGDERAALS